jgi:hypothetical protein
LRDAVPLGRGGEKEEREENESKGKKYGCGRRKEGFLCS